MTISHLTVGEPAPWFAALDGCDLGKTVALDELAGRHIVLFFFESAAHSNLAEVIAMLDRRDDLFDGHNAILLGVGSNREDFEKSRVPANRAGKIFLWDSSGTVSKQYGVAQSGSAGEATAAGAAAFILSPALQIIEILALTKPAVFVDRTISLLNAHLGCPSSFQTAPLLIVPQIFDRAFCKELIDLYESAGGREIGVVESDGKIIERFDPQFRKRFDWYISDENALPRAREMIARRLLPMVYRAFQFRTTRIERYLVGCYDATTGGYFKPHRDNMAPIVAHRRFAVTINLNDDYQGGHLRFPEFGSQIYRTAPGDAIVFSCSLLHEVLAVTHGRRYAFLSFFYDEAAQQVRDEYQKKFASP
jgi:peroxiredoxin